MIDPKHFRVNPQFNYNGLTIIMSNPSRFDDKKLLSGVTGFIFNRDCLQPNSITQAACSIKLIEDNTPLLPNTKCILLLGEKAHKLYTKKDTRLDENRGSPIIVDNIPCISSFSPQDCLDHKDYESEKNPLYQSVEDFLSEEIAAGEAHANKGRNKTSRENYKFWLANDCRRVREILSNDGKLPSDPIPEPEYIIRPSSNELISVLEHNTNDYLYIDIETDLQTMDLRCIGFCYESAPSRVYIFPVLDIYYRPAYDNLHQIFKSLFFAFQNNTLVAHNGSMFDFPVLGYKYKLPVGRKLFDTLISQHRINPTVEKSLGHCMSRWTWQPYHKDQGNHIYRTNQQAEELMLYCGKDVYGMMLVKLAQLNYAKNDKGLMSAIEWSNRAIYPYLTMNFLGMRFNDLLRQAWIKENDGNMEQLLRIMKILIGTDDPFPLISSQKCGKYFHEELGYKVVKRKSKTNNASVDENVLLELKKMHPENIVIDFLLQYRTIKKETGDLKFKAWVDRDKLCSTSLP